MRYYPNMGFLCSPLVPIPLNVHPGAKDKPSLFAKVFQPATTFFKCILVHTLRHQKDAITSGLPQYVKIVEDFIDIFRDVQNEFELEVVVTNELSYDLRLVTSRNVTLAPLPCPRQRGIGVPKLGANRH